MRIQAPERREIAPALTEWLAWRRYLLCVQASHPETYELVEESAWQRLCDELARAAETALGGAGARPSA